MNLLFRRKQVATGSTSTSRRQEVQVHENGVDDIVGRKKVKIRSIGKNARRDSTEQSVAKNDDEIESFLDTTKLAYKLSLKKNSHRLNYFFDDSDIYRVGDLTLKRNLGNFTL